jgi:thiol:disulfide interchange protein DsbD
MRFKAIFIAIVGLMLSQLSVAQILEPVKWKIALEDVKGDVAYVVARATIDAGWHVYATKLSDDPNAVGPMPTTLEVEPNAHFKAVGKVMEGKYITHHDPNFDMDLNYFENTAVFKQQIKFLDESNFSLVVRLNYMSCNDEKCIFPDPVVAELPVNRGGVTVEGQETASSSDQVMSASSEGPLRWDLTSVVDGNGDYALHFTAHLQKGWHVYSQHLTPGSAEPTRFTFDTNGKFELRGETSEGTPKTVYDKSFKTNLSYFEDGAEFVQVVHPQDDAVKEITCKVVAMACNDEQCTPPMDFFFKVNLETGKGAIYDPLANQSSQQLNNDPFKLASVKLDAPLSNCGEEKENYSLFGIFLLGLLGGLVALVTPCVFPLIPLTVSFFTKGSESGKKLAVMYGVFIVLIYFLVSLPFHLSKNVDPEVLNSISTGAPLNIIFFIVFTFFAISFFGFFEITLPSSLANKADNAANLGGLIGVFFMALTLVLVSFSCTGPILGSVIGSIYADNATGVVHFLGLELSLPATKISVAMIGFGIALGLPFALFAAFPSMLKKLPKSGGWLEDFKVSLGFIEVALAIKFISNADLVQQWGLVKREVFFAIWILVFVFWALYLFGIFKFKKGQGSKKMSKTKWAFAILVSLFAVRLVFGVLPPQEWNKFKFLSGFPPPSSYSLYNHVEEFKIYKDLDEALAAAKAQGKPLFIDFTGWACVNCRKMEENVWPEKEVADVLRNDYVMCSLYVDEKVELPADQQFIYTTHDGRKKEIKTVGNKWATLQTETFNNNAQPHYALLTPEGVLLTPTRGYTPEAKDYAAWLKCGLSTYEANK